MTDYLIFLGFYLALSGPASAHPYFHLSSFISYDRAAQLLAKYFMRRLSPF